MNEPIKKLVYKLREIGVILGLSTRQLGRWIQEGKLPVRRLGKSWIMTADDMRAYLDSLPRNGGQAS